MTNRTPILFVILTVLIFSSACSLYPQTAQTPTEPEVVRTQPPTAPVTGISLPPEAPTPTQAEPTPVPPATTQPEIQIAVGRVNVDSLNLRLGPGTDHLVVRLLNTGQELLLVGRNEALDWLRVELPDGAEGWVYSQYVDTDVQIASLPLREAYGGPLFQPPAAPVDDRQPLGVSVSIENGIAYVNVTGFPSSSGILAWLGPHEGGATLLVANATASPNGNAQFYFAMPDAWADGSPIESGTMALVVSTSDGGFRITANIQYYE